MRLSVAQLVEQPILNQYIRGSIPWRRTRYAWIIGRQQRNASYEAIDRTATNLYIHYVRPLSYEKGKELLAGAVCPAAQGVGRSCCHRVPAWYSSCFCFF